MLVGLLQFRQLVVEHDAIRGIHPAERVRAREVIVRRVQLAAAVDEVRVRGLEDVKRRRVAPVLPDERQVIEDPEAAPRRRGDQVALVDAQVGDRRDRQVELERRPVPPAVP